MSETTDFACGYRADIDFGFPASLLRPHAQGHLEDVRGLPADVPGRDGAIHDLESFLADIAHVE